MNFKTIKSIKAPWKAGLFLVVSLLTACASGPGANPHDPLEPFNRGVFKLNDAVDRVFLKPVATAYVEVAPSLLRKGVTNFFDNLDDAWSFVNNALQLKGLEASDSLARFGVNTFLGLGGLLDIASDMKIDKHSKDFGLTLGFWGVAPGPYLVLPLLGPSTVRDGVARLVDTQADVAANIGHIPTRNTITVVRGVDKRAGLLKATAMLDEIALDRYTFSRDSYLQSRRSAIYDGNPPDEADADTSAEPTNKVKP